MKKIATNTLVTLVLIGVMSLSSVNVSALSGQASRTNQQQLKRLERVYQRHDRKHELRASLLGMTPEELRIQLKRASLESVIKKHGFKDKLTFYIALTGKLKDELRRRGWSERKIEEQVEKRLARLAGVVAKPMAIGA
jgi:hypothetical protein